jgi:putative heme-binding domain-containing protein
VVDLEFAPGGDMYVARFGREGVTGHPPSPTREGDVYRFIYAPWITNESTRPNPLISLAGDPEKGKALFTARACVTCHSVDRSSSLLGPDLKDIALTMDRSGLLESILEPSKNIKTDYDTTQVTKRNGEKFVGCVASSDEENITLRMPGGGQASLPKGDVAKVEILPASLMPAGLLTGVSADDKNNLFAYLESLAIDRTLRINAGGETAKTGGTIYLADTPYHLGGYGHTRGEIAVADSKADDATLKSCRYGNVAYRFDCNAGDYDVTLSFAENWFSQPGQRVFSILLNGQVVIADLDIVREAGVGKPLKKTFRVKATQGHIDLSSTSKVNNALISAIEIQAAPRN